MQIPFAVPLTVPVTPDADEARQLLQEELSNGIYQQAEPSLLERVWTGILNWLAETLSQIQSVDAGLGTILLAVGAVVVILVAVLLIRPRLNARRSRTVPTVFDEDSRLSAKAHRDLAEAAASRGKWDEALTERFRGITRAAEERLIIDELPGRTAGEVARALQAAFSPHSAEIAWLATRFNEVHYGARPAVKQDYERAVALDDELARSQPQSGGTSRSWAVPV